MTGSGVFVTGTDTGVGKTTVTCALLRILAARGVSAVPFKPVETGCCGEDLLPADGQRLLHASGLDLDLDSVVPYRLPEPVAPAQAAKLAGVSISFPLLVERLEALRRRFDVVLAETAGGLHVPLNDAKTSADLIQASGFPVLLVAANRLGVLNHTLLTVEALRSRQIPILAVLLNQAVPEADPSCPGNGSWIRAFSGLDVMELPHAAGETGAFDRALDSMAARLV